MSGMTNLGTLGEVAAAAGDAYAGYQGGLHQRGQVFDL